MSDNERVLNADVRAMLDEHLFAVDRALSEAGVPDADRRAVCDEVEAQVCEMVWQRAEGEPTRENMTAVLAELDDPGDYYRQAVESAVPTGASGAKIHPFALLGLLAPVAEILYMMMPGHPVDAPGFIYFGVVTFLSVIFATLAICDIRREPDRYFGISLALLGTLAIPLVLLNVFAVFAADSDPFGMHRLREREKKAALLAEDRERHAKTFGTEVPYEVPEWLVEDDEPPRPLTETEERMLKNESTIVILTHVVVIGSSVVFSILLFMFLWRLCRPRERTDLDWLDSRKGWQFVVILYLARWLALAPFMILMLFLDLGELAASEMETLLQMHPALLLVFIVVVSPLLETLIECTLPYFVLSRLRPRRHKMPARQWDFVIVSALLMVLFHPTPAALVPSFITGAFLAYCYAHFARHNAAKAILATMVFHGAINIVGWGMLMLSLCQETLP